MNRGLEALENIKIDMEYVTRLDFVEPVVRGEVQQDLYKIYHRETPELEIIEKELKALEIIKEKRVDVDYFIYTCVVDDWSYEDYLEEYNSTSSWFICGQRSFGYQGKEQPLLTQEEYYLLKEVLL